MKKSLKYIVLSLLLLALAACSKSIGYQEVKQAMEKEGLKVEYGDAMEEKYFEYEINGKATLHVSVLRNESDVKQSKESLEQNAREKKTELRTFEVENLLFAYYPPKDKDEDLEKKVRNAIENLKK